MKLIDDWRSAWKFWSVQLAALIAVWAALPVELQTALLGLVGLPADIVPGVLAVLVVAARVLRQDSLKP